MFLNRFECAVQSPFARRNSSDGGGAVAKRGEEGLETQPSETRRNHSSYTLFFFFPLPAFLSLVVLLVVEPTTVPFTGCGGWKGIRTLRISSCTDSRRNEEIMRKIVGCGGGG